MFNSENILKKTFIILTIILIAEITYLGISFYKENLTNKNQTSNNQTIQTNQEQQQYEESAYSDEIIENLKKTNKNILKFSILENTYEGILTEININENEEKNTISIKNNHTGNKFYYNQDELKKIKAYNENGKEINFNNLKINSKIILKEQINMLENINNNLISAEIYVQKE